MPFEHEVHQHLLQLHAISQDREALPPALSDGYVVSRRLAAQEDDHLSNDFVYVYELPLRSTLLEEQPNPADDFRRTHSVFRASLAAARASSTLGVARQPANAGVGVGDGAPIGWFTSCAREAVSSPMVVPCDVCEIACAWREASSPACVPDFCLQRLVGFWSSELSLSVIGARRSDSMALLCAALSDPTNKTDTVNTRKRGISPALHPRNRSEQEVIVEGESG